MGKIVNRRKPEHRDQLSLMDRVEHVNFPVGDRKPAARKTDPDTSRQAARSVTNLTEKQQAILTTLKAFGPLTDSELVDTYNREHARQINASLIPLQSDSGLRTRRHELAEAGLVRDIGKKKLPTGRQAIIWVAT